MIFRFSSVGHSDRKDVLHRTTTLLLVVVAVALSIASGTTGLCETARTAPNFVIILIDDKY